MDSVLKLNLQHFAEGESNEPQLPNPDDIFGFSDNVYYDEEGNAIDKPGAGEQQAGETTPQQTETQNPPADDQQQQTTEQTNNQQTDDKRAQTPEENAQFAAQRRQQQEQQRQEQIRQEAERIAQEKLANSPQALLAKQLEAMYGMPVDQLVQQMEQANLARQAEQSGVPVEFLKQQQDLQRQIEELKQQSSKAQFDNWYASKQAEKADIMQRYPALSEADVDSSIESILTTFRNHSMPLEQAVMAMHSQKILDGIKEAERQNALAEVSGREKGPLSPQGRPSQSDTPALTPEMKEMARKMGISEKDYALWIDKDTM